MQKSKVLFFCIGTDRSTGDCLGPLVGTFLQKRLDDFKVMGTLEHPIHAANLNTDVEQVRVMYPEYRKSIWLFR